jgi:hypothetical protein
MLLRKATPISAATEETTYQRYVLPRIEALSRHSWVAGVVAVFWWTLQHCALRGFLI